MTRRPLITAGILLGIGLGGFVDGIVLHQVLQLHGQVSARVPMDSVEGLRANMLWNGLFHAFTWLMVAIGLAVLWNAGARRDVPWSGRTFGGGLVFGWGLFNVVEGLLMHHIMHLHHVVEAAGGVSIWDYVFLVSGVLLMITGWLMIGRARRVEAGRPSLTRTARPGIQPDPVARDAPAVHAPPSASAAPPSAR